MDQMPTWISDLMSTYVLPYWPWVVGAILGLLILRYALRRVINRAVGLIAGALIFGGSAATGGSTWLSDRGLNLPNFGF